MNRPPVGLSALLHRPELPARCFLTALAAITLSCAAYAAGRRHRSGNDDVLARARPDETRWTVEGFDAGEWLPATMWRTSREETERHLVRAHHRHPVLAHRLIRERRICTVHATLAPHHPKEQA
ncbi:hypothetical protein [Streptomyces sp. NBC_01264]|uniref:hypothetical protein n=1 Tax=Streptomyces sp. NBC_01264 TaxID=2903804 RepID=UPI00225468CE|nr:hypothetical protein [Streptomyces sp. NBC_01264]MCX4784097.1 hypothetical protein [Streptomyces sp. NBC_01264]